MGLIRAAMIEKGLRLAGGPFSIPDWTSPLRAGPWTMAPFEDGDLVQRPQHTLGANCPRRLRQR